MFLTGTIFLPPPMKSDLSDLSFRMLCSLLHGTNLQDTLQSDSRNFRKMLCHYNSMMGCNIVRSPEIMEKRYFAMQVHNGWWIFGLDQALHEVLNVFQFKYFVNIVSTKFYN